MHLTIHPRLIVSTNIAKAPGHSKYPVAELTIDLEGIVGDKHRGIGNRQISILSQESLDKFNVHKKTEDIIITFDPVFYAKNLVSLVNSTQEVLNALEQSRSLCTINFPSKYYRKIQHLLSVDFSTTNDNKLSKDFPDEMTEFLHELRSDMERFHLHKLSEHTSDHKITIIDDPDTFLEDQGISKIEDKNFIKFVFSQSFPGGIGVPCCSFTPIITRAIKALPTTHSPQVFICFESYDNETNTVKLKYRTAHTIADENNPITFNIDIILNLTYYTIRYSNIFMLINNPQNQIHEALIELFKGIDQTLLNTHTTQHPRATKDTTPKSIKAFEFTHPAIKKARQWVTRAQQNANQSSPHSEKQVRWQTAYTLALDWLAAIPTCFTPPDEFSERTLLSANLKKLKILPPSWIESIEELTMQHALASMNEKYFS